MGPSDSDPLERGGEGLREETSRAPQIGMLLGDERTTPAVLYFLQDTKAGEPVSMAALGVEAGVGGG